MRKVIQGIGVSEYPFNKLSPTPEIAYRVWIFNAPRRAGNTTILIDCYIQLLMRGFEIHIQDHYDNNVAHDLLLRRIIDRLRIEHHGLTLLFNKQHYLMKVKQGDENMKHYEDYSEVKLRREEKRGCQR